MNWQHFVEEMKKLGFPVYERSLHHLASRNGESPEATAQLRETPVEKEPQEEKPPGQDEGAISSTREWP